MIRTERSSPAMMGSLGIVIGHEITHGFDSTWAALYDKDGNLSNWWTDEDRAAFKERTRTRCGRVLRERRGASRKIYLTQNLHHRPDGGRPRQDVLHARARKGHGRLGLPNIF